MFISCEVDWGVTTPADAPAVQCALSGNSPLNFSQIVALAIDNGRCGADVQFVFTDSGFILNIPAFNQGIYPVFTNALMFYVVASQAGLGDTTSFQILNSMPPPVQISTTQEVNQDAAPGVSLTTASNTPIIGPPTSGTVSSFNLIVESSSTGTVTIELVDGNGTELWGSPFTLVADTTIPITVGGLHVRFFNGLYLRVVSPSGVTGPASVSVNVYYGVP